MDIKTIAATLGATALIAAGGLMPMSNTSETGHAAHALQSTSITREVRSNDAIELRDGSEHMFVNYSDVEVLAVMYMDGGDASTARLMVDVMGSDYVLGELDGFEYDGTFRVKDAGYCQGLEGSLDYMPISIVACADGTGVLLVMGTNQDDVVDIAQQVYEDGAFAVPAGYVEEEV